MTIAGLTGGIACGKTTVSKIMRECGFVVISADDISHKITEKNRLVLSQIKKKFGKEFLNKDGSLKREDLAKIIFADIEKREILNKIVHPQIIRRIEDEISAYKKMGVDIIIIEAALLFEIGYERNVDIKLVVAANSNLQIKRLMKRDNFGKANAISRIKSQLPIEKKIGLSDFTIYNNGSLEELEYEVINLLAFLQMHNERHFRSNPLRP